MAEEVEMLFAKRKSQMVAAEDALPGRTDHAMTVPEEHFINHHPLTPPWPTGYQTAIFALGCFWGAERKFWQTPGVWTTAVGYAGGFTPNPTYEEVCSGRTGHAEAVLVVFDPEQISYEQLLKVFWEEHDPTQGMRQGNDVGTQYRSAIYYADEAQRRVAEASAAMFAGQAARRRLRRDHDGDGAGRALLLRRAVPPAVPRQEPERLLRSRRHRCELPDRCGLGRRLSQARAALRARPGSGAAPRSRPRRTPPG